MLTGERWRAGGDLRVATVRIATAGAWVAAFMLTLWASINYIGGGGVGMDSHAYWLAGRSAHPYHIAPGNGDAYLYSPLFAQLMRPLALMPWPVFCAAWAVMLAAVAWWLTRPLAWRWRVPALALCWAEILTGNVNLLLAASLVLAAGGRAPMLAGFALTKITPAGVLCSWWATGRRWRDLALGLGATLLLAGVSFALEPGLWREWIAFLWSHRGGEAANPLRMAASLAVAAWAVRSRDSRWLALALWLSLPMASVLQIQPAVVLVAAARLGRLSSSQSSDSRPAESQGAGRSLVPTS